MGAELDLEAQQRAAFDRYVGGIRNRTEQMRQDTDPLMSAAWEELAKPQPDMSRVERLFDEAAEKRRAIQHDTTSQTVELLAALSPAQRAKFVATMREWRAARGRPPGRPRSPGVRPHFFPHSPAPGPPGPGAE